MFSKIKETQYPPSKLPLLIWDGECGFCKYWITNWTQKTKNRIDFKPYQEAAKNFPDIPLKEFKKASRLIETDGSIYSGPNSAFRSFIYFDNKNKFWYNLYSRNKLFAFLSDAGYNFIAKHRNLMFKLTKIFFGTNPKSLKPYWLLGLVLMVLLIYFLAKFL